MPGTTSKGNCASAHTLSREPDSQCSGHFEDHFKSWYCSWGERFVEALPPEPGVLGDLGHSTRARYISQREEQEVCVICFEDSGHLLGDGCIVGEIARRIEGAQLGLCLGLAHGLGSS